MKNNNGFYNKGSFGKWSWLIFGLFAVLIVLSLWNQDAPPWAQCKESLLQQMLSDTCTPTKGIGIIKTIPASPGQDT